MPGRDRTCDGRASTPPTVRSPLPYGWVDLFYFDCTTADPTAEPKPETGFRWVEARELLTLSFPGANEAILEELSHEADQPKPT